MVLSGDYGKLRQGVIIQSDLFLETNSVTILPLTSHLVDAYLFRIEIEPSPTNGINTTAQVMVDKWFTIPRDKIGKVIGHADSRTMLAIVRAWAVFI